MFKFAADMAFSKLNIRNYITGNRRQTLIGTGIYIIAMILTSTITTITP